MVNGAMRVHDRKYFEHDGHITYHSDPIEMWTHALGITLGNNNDICTFVRLTNSYFLVGGEDEAEYFCKYIIYINKNESPKCMYAHNLRTTAPNWTILFFTCSLSSGEGLYVRIFIKNKTAKR
ncbi:hypothetical protein Zmor_024465 [Zophobas morio]|uniref:Uncharacterized protein n=1 Tax=Zophobas morio TaxID=2755281 RepID=A0AA38I0L4_9CUCU|nr:hypothetical protein Zmor_024465 [Zophobas morio]